MGMDAGCSWFNWSESRSDSGLDDPELRPAVTALLKGEGRGGAFYQHSWRLEMMGVG
jgi:hypothetical protein